ncbi:LysR family transcriptional regulator [Sphingomonas sp. Leaf407]|uniref:LysR family transcriptional regulator n=1 Tax=unclassified Sphingomonas TaxID=196159 RepID=UPI0006FF12F3|nr:MULTISPECIES: LysR family transcriptional regulator [unclassified Sphingomonas]KQN40656.1 LysR family transcriptional regulator [Sphingomonas sp. Leaf42]KQT30012.1 LysR family transcriptional regulator [Sphingomonas sp. Leaf407]
MRLPDFEAWAMFACVVEHRSFSAAAASIGVSKATVSKAVARLEVSLGTTLFHRTSRRLALTDAGQSLSERAARILAEAQGAEEQARDAAAAPTGLVRVAAPMSFGLAHVAPAIADFLAAHPGVEIDLTLSDAKVDIVADGIDVALRIADLPDSSLRARRLAPVAIRIVAAPAYWEKHGRPTHPADLGHHACFGYTNLPNAIWHFRQGAEEVAVRPAGPLATNNGEAMLPALRAGLGVARLPDFLVDADIAAGRLEPVLEAWTGAGVALHLLTPPGTLRPARVEALIEFLSERFRRLCQSR